MLQFRGKIILGAKLYFCQPLFSKFRCPTSNRFTLKHKYFASVSKDFNYTRCEKAVFYFEINFWFLHEHFQLPMTLKIHVIIDHYNCYFKEMGKNFLDTFSNFITGPDVGGRLCEAKYFGKQKCVKLKLHLN